MCRPDIANAPRALSAGQVALWLLDPTSVGPDWLLRHQALLTSEEIHRVAALSLTPLRHDALCTRIMQRWMLSTYADVDPTDWRFAPTPHGRPEILIPSGHRLRFNIAHTRGLIAMALRVGGEVGVDVEALAHARDVEAISARFFAADETAALMRLDGEARRHRFLELWTLKEACLKALGTGLATALDAVRFEHAADGAIRQTFGPGLTTPEGSWRFETLYPTPDHVMSLAILSSDAMPAETCLQWFSSRSRFRE